MMKAIIEIAQKLSYPVKSEASNLVLFYCFGSSCPSHLILKSVLPISVKKDDWNLGLGYVESGSTWSELTS